MKLSKDFWQGWSIGRESGEQVLELLNKHKPKKILDLGSGYSTVLFGLWAKENNAQVTSLEQSKKYYKDTRDLLEEYKIQDYVDLRCSQLANTPYGLFYDVEALPDNIDFVMIDGPAWTQNGRKATFHKVYPYLAKDFIVWQDDAYRSLDKIGRQEWLDTYPIKISEQNSRAVLVTPL